jgi:hypothetical protein
VSVRKLGRLAAVVAVLALLRPAGADVVVLRNGRELAGKILREDADQVTLSVAGVQGSIRIHRAEIVRIARDGEPEPAPVPVPPSTLEEVDRRLAALGPSPRDLALALAAHAASDDRVKRALNGLGGRDSAPLELARAGDAGLSAAADALEEAAPARRRAAAKAIALAATDEERLPAIVALEVPGRLLELLARGGADADAARGALVAVARGEPSGPGDDYGRWCAWWAKERAEVERFESVRDRERAALQSARRAITGGRAEVTLAHAGRPEAPERTVARPALVVSPPEEIRLETDAAGHRRIRFGVVVSNLGRGPLELRAATGDHGFGFQDVFAVASTGELALDHERALGRLTWDAGHRHFHLAGFARYELLDDALLPVRGAPGEGDAGCLSDVRRVVDRPWVERSPRRKGDGISPGWACARGPDTGPAIALDDSLPDGAYYLVARITAPLEEDEPVAAPGRAAATRLRIRGHDAVAIEQLEGAAFAERRVAALRRAAEHGGER